MSPEIHSSKLRSHVQFPIKDERKIAIGLIGKDVLEEAETKLMETILDRVPEDDETGRMFDVRWVLSCYVVYSEIKKEKEKLQVMCLCKRMIRKVILLNCQKAWNSKRTGRQVKIWLKMISQNRRTT